MGKLMNILPVSDLRQDAAKVLKQLRDNKEPIIITQRGRAAAVIIGVEAYEKSDVNVRFTPSARTQFLSALSYIRQDKPFFYKTKAEVVWIVAVWLRYGKKKE